MIMGAGTGALPLGQLLLIPLIFAVFYFIVILPHKKQQKRKEAMITALKKGDRVVTTGGIFGTIAAAEEHSVMLKVAENTKLRVAKSAIAGPVSGDGIVPELEGERR